MSCLGCDVFCDSTGKLWSAVITEFPGGVTRWRKDGMKSEHNALVAMEAAYQRLSKPDTTGESYADTGS